MTTILTNRTPKGELLQATFLPEMGMNLISFKKDDLEIIDQSTKAMFEERFAGLGALIGPHFHRKRKEVVPKVPDESLFPHIERIKRKGIEDPFSHGIARYAPWKFEATDRSIKGVLTGKDTWNGVPLQVLEGQNFKMEYAATLSPHGMAINLSIVSDTDSLVGIHYYYHLPKGKGRITSEVQENYLDGNSLKKIPQDWLKKDFHRLDFDLAHSADYTFYPFPNPLFTTIVLDAYDYRLQTTYQCMSQENAWQLYHPEGASFVCIEPVSSQDPRHPNLTVSSLSIQLAILSDE